MGERYLNRKRDRTICWIATLAQLFVPSIALLSADLALFVGASVQAASAVAIGPAAAAEVDRGIIVQPVVPHSGIEILPPPAPIIPKPPAEAAPLPPEHKSAVLAPVRLAATDGRNPDFAGLKPRAPYEIVDPKANPDAVWNPQSLEVTVAESVIARHIEAADLAGIIDRIAVVHWLQSRPQKAHQSVRILPDDRVHRKNSVVEIELDGLANRSLILLNIAGDGTVQLLYPRDADPPMRDDPQYRVQLQVGDPLGADEIVALSSAQPMPALTEALRHLDRGRDPTKTTEAIETLGPVDLLLGSAGLFTAP
jgi:hypothetical protein